MKKLFYLLLFLCCSFSWATYAQTSVIRYVWDKNKKDVLRKVEFYDTKKDSVFKTINVFKQNPFNHFKFPALPDSSANKIYDFNGVTMNEVFPDSLFKSRPDWSKIHSLGLVQGTSTSSWFVDNPGFVVLYYTFQSYVIEGSQIGQTALFVFNKEGKLIKADYEPQLVISQLFFTPSGRYLAYTTGKFTKDAIDMPSGSRMFDFQSPGFSYFEKEFNPGLYFLPDEKLMSVTDNQANDSTRRYYYKIFDIGARKVYTKTLSGNDMSNILNLTADCIILKENRRIYYKTDFKVADLK
ncbi:MAG: hypothetical protein WCO63_14245 [Bacteroidota bacterium]